MLSVQADNEEYTFLGSIDVAHSVGEELSTLLFKPFRRLCIFI